MLKRVSIGLFIFIVGAVQAADLRPAELDRIIETTRKFWNVPGVAVAIVHDDATVYAKGFGVQRLGSSVPVSPDTRFAICSATKAFTSAALGILVDEGKLRWDDPVRQHLPYFKLADPLADANVTIRDLLSHRTGLGSHDMIWLNSTMSREEVVRRVAFLPLRHPFRSTWNYNNIMYVAAGEVVRHVSGASWEAFVQERLLNPLGMTNSGIHVPTALKLPGHASPHERRGEQFEAGDSSYDLDLMAPAGGVDSSVRDLTRWMRLHLNNGKFEGKVLLKEGTIREMHRPQMVMRTERNIVNEGPHMAAYGLGWFVQDYRGHHIVYHPGLNDGWNSVVLFLPDERYGVAILTNAGRDIQGVLRSAILDELLGLPTKDRNPLVLAQRQQADEKARREWEESKARRAADSKPSLAAEDYAGSYEHPAYGTVVVRVSGRKMELEWHNWRGSLAHYQFDTFLAERLGPMPDVLVQFRLNLNGKVGDVYFQGQQFYRRQ